MVDDPNRKTARQFQCRDYLWDSFEQLSSELECSIDYLINEAMRHYLRAQGRAGTTRPTGPGIPAADRASMPSPALSGSMPARAPTPAAPTRQPAIPPMPAARPPSMGGGAPPMRPSMPQAGQQQQPSGPAIPPLGAPGRAPPAMPSMPSLPQRGAPGQGVPSMPGMGAPQQQAAQPAMMQKPAPAPQMAPPPQRQAPSAPAQRVLFAIYADQEVPVTKEEFFIGRGQKMCDLVIRDTNISRQHARVVLHNGQYWMIDNQSTNGVEYRGAKIQQKRIDEGDVFTICGHDVHFTYR